MIVLLLIRIRLISLLELGASGPSPLLGELPPSLLFITICSMKCVILLLSYVCFVFCALASGNAPAAANICLCSEQLEGGGAGRAEIQQYYTLLHNKVVNSSLRNDLITV